MFSIFKNSSKTLFVTSFIFMGVIGSHSAFAFGDPVNKEAAEVDPVALEVQKITSLEDAEKALDETYKTISMYQSTLRQLGKGLGFDNDRKGLQEAIEATERMIQAQRRKAVLLNNKIETLK